MRLAIIKQAADHNTMLKTFILMLSANLFGCILIVTVYVLIVTNGAYAPSLLPPVKVVVIPLQPL